MATGLSTSVTRIGSNIWASSWPSGGLTSCTGCQSSSLNPASLQPAMPKMPGTPATCRRFSLSPSEGGRAGVRGPCLLWGAAPASTDATVHSRRASYSSPSNSLLARIGPLAVTFQRPSVTTSVPRTVFVFDAHLQPQFRIAKRRRRERHLDARREELPLPRITPIALVPALRYSVTSKVTYRSRLP